MKIDIQNIRKAAANKGYIYMNSSLTSVGAYMWCTISEFEKFTKGKYLTVVFKTEGIGLEIFMGMDKQLTFLFTKDAEEKIINLINSDYVITLN